MMSRASRLCACPQRCGGGLVQDRAPFPMPNGRPRFTCTKCGHQFTNGLDGHPYAAVVPMKIVPPIGSRP